MTPKHTFTETKRTLFLKNRHILTPYRARESHLASTSNPFFAFLWSLMCATLLFEWPPRGMCNNNCILKFSNYQFANVVHLKIEICELCTQVFHLLLQDKAVRCIYGKSLLQELEAISLINCWLLVQALAHISFLNYDTPQV